MLIDISRPLLTCPPFPGDPAPILERLCDFDQGYRLCRLTTTLHTATHIDAPLHFIPKGDSIDRLDLALFYGVVQICRHPNQSDGTKRLLLRGDGSLCPEDCDMLWDKGVRLIGVEAPSIGDIHAPAAMHCLYLGKGFALMENLDLSQTEDGHYILSALPLYIEGGEASPCRAVLITP